MHEQVCSGPFLPAPDAITSRGSLPPHRMHHVNTGGSGERQNLSAYIGDQLLEAAPSNRCAAQRSVRTHSTVHLTGAASLPPSLRLKRYSVMMWIRMCATIFVANLILFSHPLRLKTATLHQVRVQGASMHGLRKRTFRLPQDPLCRKSHQMELNHQVRPMCQVVAHPGGAQSSTSALPCMHGP